MPHGTEGRPVELVANFYKFTTEPNMSVFFYDVNIKRKEKEKNKSDKGSGDEKKESGESSGNNNGSGPSSGSGNGNGSGEGSGNGNGDDVISSSSTSTPTDSHHSHSGTADSTNLERFIKKFSPQIVEKLVAENEQFRGVPWVFDGQKNLYTKKKLNFGGHKRMQFQVQLDMGMGRRPADFDVKMKLVECIAIKEVFEYYAKTKDNLSDRAISIYETVFRFIMGKEFETFQRKFFDMPTVQNVPRVRLAEFVQGFTSGVRMTEVGLALNLHLKTSCIVNRQITTVFQLAQAICNVTVGERITREQVVALNKFFRHLRIFTTHSGRELTYTMDGVQDKFPEEMKFTDRTGYPVSVDVYFREVHRREVQRLPLIKTTGKMPRFIPMELCLLKPNQFLSNQKIDSQIQRELLFKSTHTPNVYFDKLDNIVKKVANAQPEIRRAFGIALETKPLSFQGRVLPSPVQLNGDNRSKFYRTKPTPLKWAVFSFDMDITDEELQGFVDQMIKRAKYFGLDFNQPNPVTRVRITHRDDIFTVVCNIIRRTEAQFIFFGIPPSKY